MNTKKDKLQKTCRPAIDVIRGMWHEAIAIALGVFVASLLYQVVANVSFTPDVIATAVKAVAVVMIGWSNMLSGFSYHFDFLDSQLGYRKHIGLFGYLVALLYAILLLFTQQSTYFYGLSENLFTKDVGLGLIAMAIFMTIVIVANSSLKLKMGYKRFRYLLRTTYLAYFLLLVRECHLESDAWLAWAVEPTTLPPLTLILAFFATCVFLMRGSIIIVELFRKRRLI